MSITSQIIYNKANNFFSSPESKCTCGGCNNFVEFVLEIPIIQNVCNFNISSSISIEKISTEKISTEKILTDKISKSNQPQFQPIYIYKFVINSKKLKTTTKNYYKFFSYEKKNYKLSIKNINKFIVLIKNILPKLNFNKFAGIFEFDIDANSKLINFANSETNNILGLDVFDSTHTNSNECCICYDKTLIKTSCGHFLCVECWECMKDISECPYCRHKKIKISKK
jgi:hypothetical protein